MESPPPGVLGAPGRAGVVPPEPGPGGVESGGVVPPGGVDPPGVVPPGVVPPGVVPPGAGDQIQMAKAGIMEIADVFVVNKGDLPGAGTTAGDLRSAVRLRPSGRWRPPVVVTVANRPDEPPVALWEAIEAHRASVAAGQDRIAQRSAEPLEDRGL